VISDFPFPDTDEGLRSVPGRVMGAIQFFEAQIDDQLLPRAYYDTLLARHGFTDPGSASLTPMHALTWAAARSCRCGTGAEVLGEWAWWGCAPCPQLGGTPCFRRAPVETTLPAGPGRRFGPYALAWRGGHPLGMGQVPCAHVGSGVAHLLAVRGSGELGSG
jgi:hypothetical protein